MLRPQIRKCVWLILFLNLTTQITEESLGTDHNREIQTYLEIKHSYIFS
jgi:hypothetical protein